MDSGAEREADGGYTVEFDSQELYVVVRKAVEDAMLNVVGTLLLVGIALICVWSGAAVLLSGQWTGGYAVGGGLLVFGFYLAAATLEVIPPIREWI